jgi:carboxymethylenebutenolidase
MSIRRCILFIKTIIIHGGTIMPQQPALTVDEQKLNDVWNEHLRAEFSAYSADETLATMVANPRNHLVPVMIGGDGKEEVYEFYAEYCLSQIPPDFRGSPDVADHRPREAGR